MLTKIYKLTTNLSERAHPSSLSGALNISLTWVAASGWGVFAIFAEPLAATERLKATPLSSSEIQLTWALEGDAEGYTIEEVTASGDWQAIASNPPKVTIFTHHSLVGASEHQYRVWTHFAAPRPDCFSIVTAKTFSEGTIGFIADTLEHGTEVFWVGNDGSTNVVDATPGSEPPDLDLAVAIPDLEINWISDAVISGEVLYVSADHLINGQRRRVEFSFDGEIVRRVGGSRSASKIQPMGNGDAYFNQGTEAGIQRHGDSFRRVFNKAARFWPEGSPAFDGPALYHLVKSPATGIRHLGIYANEKLALLEVPEGLDSGLTGEAVRFQDFLLLVTEGGRPEEQRLLVLDTRSRQVRFATTGDESEDPQNPREFTQLGGTLYFAASADSRKRLWSFDGTSFSIHDSIAAPKTLFVHNNRLLLAASVSGQRRLYAFDGVDVEELGPEDRGVTDITLLPQGPVIGHSWNTIKVFDGEKFESIPGLEAPRGRIGYVTPYRDNVYFTIMGDSSGQLWKFDIKSGRASPIGDVLPSVGRLLAGGDAFMIHQNGTSLSLVRTDDTVEPLELRVPGTRADWDKILVRSMDIVNAVKTSSGDTLFQVSNGRASNQLMRISNSGIEQLGDPPVFFRHRAPLGNSAYFSDGRSFWKYSEGSLNKPQIDSLSGTRIISMMATDRFLYLTGLDAELNPLAMAFDGESTHPIPDLTPFGKHLDFLKTDGTRVLALADKSYWLINGLEAMRLDSQAIEAVSNVTPIALQGDFYVVLSAPETGRELFKINEAGITLVADLEPGESGSNPYTMLKHNGDLFFTANTTSDGDWLYILDEDGVKPVLRNGRLFRESRNPDYAIATDDGELLGFFQTETDVGEPFLWPGPGSEPTPLGDIYPGPAGSVHGRAAVSFKGSLYSVLADPDHGAELWEIRDGKATRLTDLLPGPGSSFDGLIAKTNDALYWSANDGTTGFELWKFDGEQLTLENNAAHDGPQGLGSLPTDLLFHEDTLFFQNGDESQIPNARYHFDGSDLGELVLEGPPGRFDGPVDWLSSGNRMFFSASDEERGNALFEWQNSEAVFVAGIKHGEGASEIALPFLITSGSSPSRTLWILVDGQFVSVPPPEGARVDFLNNLERFGEDALVKASVGEFDQIWRINPDQAITVLPYASGSNEGHVDGMAVEAGTLYLHGSSVQGEELLLAYRDDEFTNLFPLELSGFTIRAFDHINAQLVFYALPPDRSRTQIWALQDLEFRQIHDLPGQFGPVLATVGSELILPVTTRERSLVAYAPASGILTSISRGLQLSDRFFRKPFDHVQINGVFYFAADRNGERYLWAYDGNSTCRAGSALMENPRCLMAVDFNRPPERVEISSTTILPGLQQVGALRTIDPDDGDQHSYALVPGIGDADNALFEIASKALHVRSSAELEERDYLIRVRTVDSGGRISESTITLSYDQAQGGGFVEWLNQRFAPEEVIDPAIASPNSDPDGNGQSNLAEYAFGFPSERRIAIDGDTGDVVLRFGVALPERRDVRYSVEASSDLGDWTELAWTNPPLAEWATASDDVAISFQDGIVTITKGPILRFEFFRVRASLLGDL